MPLNVLPETTYRGKKPWSLPERPFETDYVNGRIVLGCLHMLRHCAQYQNIVDAWWGSAWVTLFVDKSVTGTSLLCAALV